MLKTYYMLTKPGIIMGNVITMAAGFALASRGHFDYLLFLETLLGLGFVIASAGVFNSYLDRAADAKMSRTKDRPLVQGTISSQNALLFATLLGGLGAIILGIFTNLLTVFVAFTGFFVYLVLYAFWKYRSFYGTLVGSVAGAVPPVVGYCAVSNRFDTGAFLLFMILLLWQMPHFFAIAIYHIKDYSAASIPVLPIQRGVSVTKVHMLLYIVAFTFTALMLTFLGYTGSFYLVIAALLGISWFTLGAFGLSSSNDVQWARKMFVYSLVVIMTLCVTIAFDS
jgi:heme o synthase